MSKDNNFNAVDKLDEINSKIGCIISVVSFTNIDVCSFNDEDIVGFTGILRDLQKNVNEVKKLLS